MKISEIKLHPLTMRQVNKDSDEFENLKRSIEARGLLVPLSVGQIATDIFLLDGEYRLEACKELGMVSVPTYPVSVLTEEDFIVIQLMKSVHTVPTKPIEFTNAVIRLLERTDRELTFKDLCKKLCVTPKWLTLRLKLDKLSPRNYKRLQAGEFCIINGYMLSQLPCEAQDSFVHYAATKCPEEFVPTVNYRLKQLREYKRRQK